MLLEFYARPINYLNYYVPIAGSDRYSTLEDHLVHYPSRREKRELAGQAYQTKGLRFFGDRVVNRILGYRVFSGFNALIASVAPLRWFMVEHWVIYSPDGPASPVAADPPLSVLESAGACDGSLHEGWGAVLDRARPNPGGLRCKHGRRSASS